MAIGNEIGEFEMKATSVTLEPGKGSRAIVHVNYEGSISGDLACTALATMTVDSDDGRDGKYKVSARCFTDDNEILDATGEGKTTLKDGHKWAVAGVATLTNGTNAAVQGEIDLETRSFVGKMFERN